MIWVILLSVANYFNTCVITPMDSLHSVDFFDPGGLSENDVEELNTVKERREQERSKVQREVADVADDDTLYSWGHQLDDFILFCEYNQYECYNR